MPALGYTSHAFIDAYRRNQAEAIAMGLEASEAARALRLFAQSVGHWSGRADELLKRLKAQPDVTPTHGDGRLARKDCKPLCGGWRHLFVVWALLPSRSELRQSDS